MHPEDVAITFSQGTVVVSGERNTALATDGEDSFYIRERFYGAFRRAITLPAGTREGEISAECENGLVELIVAGAAAAAEPTRIALKTRG